MLNHTHNLYITAFGIYFQVEKSCSFWFQNWNLSCELVLCPPGGFHAYYFLQICSDVFADKSRRNNNIWMDSGSVSSQHDFFP